MAFQLVRRIGTVILVVPMGPKSGFRERAARPRPTPAEAVATILAAIPERAGHVSADPD
jgi:hypothetical protein